MMLVERHLPLDLSRQSACSSLSHLTLRSRDAAPRTGMERRAAHIPLSPRCALRWELRGGLFLSRRFGFLGCPFHRLKQTMGLRFGQVRIENRKVDLLLFGKVNCDERREAIENPA